MGFGINELGAALGGASQGAGQGLDMYAKYADIADKNRQRQTQQKIQAKIGEMAKTGIFQSDPETAMRQIGDAYAGEGDAQNYMQYIKSADELQKQRGVKAGAQVYAASMVSPEETAKHIDTYNAVQKNGAAPASYVRNPDGSFSFNFGGGAKNYKNLEDFHRDALRYVAPGTLAPEKWAELESQTAERDAGTQLKGAQTGLVGAQAGEIGALLPGKVTLQGTEAAQQRAQTGYLGALGAESGTRSAENRALLPYKVGQASAEIGATDALAEGRRADTEFNRETMGPRIQEARGKGALAEMEVGAYGPRLQAELAGKQASTTEVGARTGAIQQSTAEARMLQGGKLTGQQMELYQKAREIINEPASTALKLAEAHAQIDSLVAQTEGRKQDTAQSAGLYPGKKAQQAAETDLTRSQTEYNREGRGQMRAGAAAAEIKPYVEESVDLVTPPPIYGDEAHLGDMRDAVMTGTGSKDGQRAAALGHRALQALDQAMKRREHIAFRSGNMILANGESLPIGAEAARYLKGLHDQLTAGGK